MRTFNHHDDNGRRPMSNENRMALLLLIVAVVAFGIFSAFFYAGFLPAMFS